jgi:hypothetical protein
MQIFINTNQFCITSLSKSLRCTTPSVKEIDTTTSFVHPTFLMHERVSSLLSGLSRCVIAGSESPTSATHGFKPMKTYKTGPVQFCRFTKNRSIEFKSFKKIEKLKIKKLDFILKNLVKTKFKNLFPFVLEKSRIFFGCLKRKTKFDWFL